MLQTALHYSHTLLKEVVTAGDSVVDATMGNGHDTLFLAKLVGEAGHVYAFDVQKQALETTTQKVQAEQLEEIVSLFHQGHETVNHVLPADCHLKAAVFNLGYLPKSDKAIITQPQTTELALQALLSRLVKGGRIVLVAYYGHEGGKAELEFLTMYCQALPQEDYSVLTYQFINQRNQPPVLYCIEKK